MANTKKTKSTLTYEERHHFTLEHSPISWSSYSSFKYDKERWYRTYHKGEKQRSAELTFGSLVADSMQTSAPLCAFNRLDVNKDGTHDELEFDVWFGKIHLIGSADTCTAVKKYRRGKPFPAGEFKTGVKPWDQARVDEHGQLTFYSALLWLQEKILPDDIDWFLDWCPTQKEESGDFNHKITFVDPNDIRHFKTKRTMTQVMDLLVDIKKTHAEMLEYVKNHI